MQMRLDTHHDFEAPAAGVWEVLAAFGDIRRWWPANGEARLQRVVLEGEGVGMVRHMYRAGTATPISERLDHLDADNRILKLSVVGERPAGLRRYQATGQVRELQGGRCRLQYNSEFETEPGREAEAREFLLGAYALMFAGLRAAVTGERDRYFQTEVNDMIAISACIDMDPADAERFIEAAAPVVANTRMEKGCTLYAITRDIVESHIFWISEEWETEQDLYAHLSSAHVAEFLGRTAEMNMRSMEVRKYDVSSVGPLELPQG